jgi:DNA-binding transcriptional ArsR family regulator
MSLEAIGDLKDKHPSTVSYWLKKHGLKAGKAERHAPKGEVDRETLEALVEEGLTLREIAERLGRSATAIRHWLDKYKLKTLRPRRSPVAGDPTRIERGCRRHGRTEFVLEGRGYYRCALCRAEATGRWRQVVKRKLVEEAGGGCMICGYSRCQRALQFHHLDPTTKAFHLGQNGHTRSLSRSRAEAKKCALLCANCHAEVEAGITAMPLDSSVMLIRGSESVQHDPG